MTEPTNFKDTAQAWVSIWVDQEGGLSFEANAVSTTQLLGMVSLAKQLIIQRALSPQDNAEASAES